MIVVAEDREAMGLRLLQAAAKARGVVCHGLCGQEGHFHET